LAFKDYLAVLDSDLYEYCGTTKSILARIAHLIIAPPKEDEATGKQLGEPDPNVGFCTASQEYLACQMGLSESTIRKAVRLFEKDGWVATTRSRDQHGHEHNKYGWTPGAWDRLVARKREKDEQGEYVRKKQVNMGRYPREGQFARREDEGDQRVGSPYGDGRVALGQAKGSGTPPGKEPDGLQANSAAASRPIACPPPGRLPVKKVLKLVLKEGEQSERKTNSHSTSSPASLGVSQNPNQHQPQHQTPSTPWDASTPWDDEGRPAPVNPNPRGFAPNPTGTSRPGTPGIDIPVSPPTARPPVPRPPKQVCQRIGCGGPLKCNKGVCLKCGFEPLKKTPPPKKLKNEYGEEVEGLPHHFLSRDHEATCQNPGCDVNRRESLYDKSSKYCYGEQGKGAVA